MKKVLFLMPYIWSVIFFLFVINANLNASRNDCEPFNTSGMNTQTNHPFDGYWKINKVGSGNIEIPTYFILHQKDNQLTGKVRINNSVDIPIDNVTLSEKEASFTIFWGAKYICVPENDHLNVTIVWSGKPTITVKAVPVNEDETKHPAFIPLPEVASLPSNGLAQTPPMGWNSWNTIEIEVSDKIVRETAQAMVNSGMAKAGYNYIVIDDGWEGSRDEQGNIYPNEKFPDMRDLADYVHALGLKIGIYSSPGTHTCGGYIGSYGHEYQDAKTFADWGIDYLKYDWCGAMRIYPDSLMQRAYQKMGDALLQCGRPIVYSLCQYGLQNVWEWGGKSGANLWRTTGDINDEWNKISEIGFNQTHLADYAKPGQWNDPDMLEVGNGDLSYDENISHFSLWCMRSAPLMAGNDLRNMPHSTLSILTNKEAISINQDVLGLQAKPISSKDSVEIWVKPLVNNRKAVAVFNRSIKPVKLDYNWKELGWTKKPKKVLNVWDNKKMKFSKNTLTLEIPSHGVILLKEN